MPTRFDSAVETFQFTTEQEKFLYESHRWEQIVYLHDALLVLFESDRARRWFHAPNSAMGGRTAFDVIMNGADHEVDFLVRQIEFNAYSGW